MIKPLTKKSQLRYIKKAASGNKSLRRDLADMWQEIVKVRAKGICEYQGCHRRDRLNAHHVFTKGHTSHLRYDPANGIALCYRHHRGSNEAAHCDIHFKDKITGRYPGYRAIRTPQWLEILTLKANTGQKLDLNLEYLYLSEYYERIVGKQYKKAQGDGGELSHK
jgi:hypothetical protein